MIVTNPFSVLHRLVRAVQRHHGDRGRHQRPWRPSLPGPPLALGILETQIAFWLLEQPGLTLVAAILAIGLWSMTCGVVQIVLAFEVKSLSLRADTAARDLGMV